MHFYFLYAAVLADTKAVSSNIGGFLILDKVFNFRISLGTIRELCTAVYVFKHRRSLNDYKMS